MMRLAMVILLAGSAMAQAQDVGNMPERFYPKPACVKPATGTRKLETFNTCIQDYDTRSRRDRWHLLFTVNTAVADAHGGPPPAPPPSGDGNLPADFYPRPACIKPDRGLLGLQPGRHDRKAMAAYNQRITAYNSQVGAFNICILGYTAHARADLAAIARTVNASGTAQ